MWHATNGAISICTSGNEYSIESYIIRSSYTPRVYPLHRQRTRTLSNFNANSAHYGRESLSYDDAIEQKNKLLVKFVYT